MDFRPEEFAGKSVKLSSPVGQGHLEIWWPLTKDKEILQARVKELEDTVEIGMLFLSFGQIRILNFSHLGNNRL